MEPENLQETPSSNPGGTIDPDVAQYLMFKQMDPKTWIKPSAK